MFALMLRAKLVVPAAVVLVAYQLAHVVETGMQHAVFLAAASSPVAKSLVRSTIVSATSQVELVHTAVPPDPQLSAPNVEVPPVQRLLQAVVLRLQHSEAEYTYEATEVSTSYVESKHVGAVGQVVAVGTVAAASQQLVSYAVASATSVLPTAFKPPPALQAL